MRRFSGLRHVMPITCATFAVGCLALAGVAPLSGFWSKDAILGAVHERVHEAEHELEHRGAAHGSPADDHADPVHETTNGDSAVHDSTDTSLAASVYNTFSLEKLELHRKLYGWLYFGGIFTAFLTAFYTFRAFFMTFFGEQVIPAEAAGHAHESPRVMWMPLAVLAVFALFIGLIIFSSKPDDEGSLDRFAAFLASTPSLAYYGITETTPPSEFHMDVAALSTVVALLGIALAAFLYLGSRREIDALTYVFDFRWLARLGSYLSPYKLSQGKFFFDEIYNALIVQPLQWLAWLCYAADRWLVDGLVNFFGRVPVWIGGLMRSLHTGLLSYYGLAMVLGTLTMIAAKMLWGGD